MRYTTKHYAAALLAALKGKPPAKKKEVIRRFLFLLRKRGVWPRRQAILRAVERRRLSEVGLQKVSVEAPAAISPALRREIGKRVGGKVLWEESVRPELLAGVKILVNEELLVDASAKSRLERMFTV